MPAISIDNFYGDIYSDLYEGSPTVLYLMLEIAFNAPTEDPEWTDVSSDLRRFTTDRGRSREFDSFNPGTMTVVLDNRDRQFDPSYTSSPYYPNVVPMRRIRLRAWWVDQYYDIFSGFIDAWPQSYVFPHEATVSLHCTDAFKVFAAQKIPSVWEQEVRLDSPVSWYRLSERDQAYMADSVGNNHGVYSGGPSTSSSLLTNDTDGAVSLNGTTQYVAANFPLTKPFTIELWMKANENQPEDVPMLFGFAGSNGVFLSLYLNPDTLRFNVDNTLGGFSTLSLVDSTVEVTDEQPHHVVVQYSASSQKVYVDGVDVSTPGPYGPYYANAIQAGLLHFGDQPNSTNSHFAGTLDEVVIYDYLLSPARIAAHYDAGHAPWADQTTGERITAVLDQAGWTGATDIDEGNSTLAAAKLDSSALAHMQEADITESGRLFIDAAGRVKFIARQAVITETPYNTSQATFGDGAGELKYSDIVPDSDDLIFNDVEIRSDVFPSQRAVDADSQDNYLVRSVSRQSLASTPEQMRSAAYWWLGRYKDPQLRVRSITVQPRRDPANLWPVALGLEMGERITVKRRPQNVGSVISQEVHIESIGHSGDAKTQSWETTFSLSSAEIQTFWRLGQSELGLDTRLAS